MAFFHHYPDGPAQKNFGIIVSGKIHTQKKHKVGESVKQRSADGDQPAAVEGYGKIPQHGNGGPTDDIAEKDYHNTQFNAKRGLGLEGA